MDVTIEELEDDMYRHVIKKRPFFVHGPPGIGKSDTVRAVARRIAKDLTLPFKEGVCDPAAFCLVDRRLTLMDPTDLTGLPFADRGMTRYLQPAWLPTAGVGILFLDELSNAAPLMQAAGQQLVLDRRAGDYTLPEGWAILAAGNRLSDKAHVFETSSALNNRFSHATLLVPSEPAWRTWAITHHLHSDVIAFVAANPQWLFKFDPAAKDPAFPTPRSWAGCSALIEGLTPDSKAAITTMFRLTAEHVGQGAAMAFEGFLKIRKTLQIDDLLTHPEKVTTIAENDQLFALSAGLASRYAADRTLMNPILAVLAYVTREDIAVFALRLMKGTQAEQFGDDLTKAPRWTTLAARFRPFLVDD